MHKVDKKYIYLLADEIDDLLTDGMTRFDLMVIKVNLKAIKDFTK